jgi:formiminotetrahydrofolate cyclodeaminase
MDNGQQVLNYLDLPANQLLEHYGSGNHLPGSGSAAAFSGLIAVEILRSACKATIANPIYSAQKASFEYILLRIEDDYRKKLVELFNQEINVYDAINQLKLQRDAADDKKEKDRINKAIIEKDKEAVQIPIGICKVCTIIIDYAFTIFESGVKETRGDAGVAISNLLSSIQGTLFVIFLNLKSHRPSKWLEEVKQQAERLTKDYHKVQGHAFKKVLELYKEGLEANQIKLNFENI